MNSMWLAFVFLGLGTAFGALALWSWMTSTTRRSAGHGTGGGRIVGPTDQAVSSSERRTPQASPAIEALDVATDLHGFPSTTESNTLPLDGTTTECLDMATIRALQDLYRSRPAEATESIPPIVSPGTHTECLDIDTIRALRAGVPAPSSPRMDDRTIEMKPPSGFAEETPSVREPLSDILQNPAVAPVLVEAPIIGLSALDLGPAFEDAVRAFALWDSERCSRNTTLEHIAHGSEQTLRQSLVVAAAASDVAARDVFERALREPASGMVRRIVASLMLLRRSDRKTLMVMDELVTDPSIADELRKALVLWRHPDADWRLLKQARRSALTRAFWCQILDLRRVDPQLGLLEELLSSSDETLVKWGIVLAKYHGDLRMRSEISQRYLHDLRRPHLRVAAVELAIFNGDPVAWMLCRQMATSRDYPRAAELLACLGSNEEVYPMFRQLAGKQGDVIWRVCRSGRKTAARHAAGALQMNPADELAATGLRYIIGESPGSRGDVGHLLDHWNVVAPTLDDGSRYLYGDRYGSQSVKACLSHSDDRHHRSLGDELFFRSKGTLRWQGPGLAVDMLEQLEYIDTLAIDFDASIAQSGRQWT